MVRNVSQLHFWVSHGRVVDPLRRVPGLEGHKLGKIREPVLMIHTNLTACGTASLDKQYLQRNREVHQVEIKVIKPQIAQRLPRGELDVLLKNEKVGLD